MNRVSAYRRAPNWGTKSMSPSELAKDYGRVIRISRADGQRGYDS
jgi:hypothetical protein